MRRNTTFGDNGTLLSSAPRAISFVSVCGSSTSRFLQLAFDIIMIPSNIMKVRVINNNMYDVMIDVMICLFYLHDLFIRSYVSVFLSRVVLVFAQRFFETVLAALSKMLKETA